MTELAAFNFTKIRVKGSILMRLSPSDTVLMMISTKLDGYVPESVEVRMRINGSLYTALTQAKHLTALDGDEHIRSIEVSTPIFALNLQ